MTSKLAKFVFFLYHTVFVSQNANCRYSPTCSKYALDAIEKYGAIKGSFLSLKRLLSCHPFSQKPIIDPA